MSSGSVEIITLKPTSAATDPNNFRLKKTLHKSLLQKFHLFISRRYQPALLIFFCFLTHKAKEIPAQPRNEISIFKHKDINQPSAVGHC